MAGKTCSKSAKVTERAAKPIVIAGGNPQIVQAYIAAMPGWENDAGRHKLT